MKSDISIDNQVISRVYGKGRGSVFTPNDFSDLGAYTAVAKSLSRYAKAGTIRRLAPGVYDYPATDPLAGTLSPSPEKVARALAGRDATKLQPAGAYAANLLGLSEQVPMRVVFLTDGHSRKVKVGSTEILLRHSSTRFLSTRTEIGGLIIQALRYLGKDHVGDREYTILRKRVPAEARKEMLTDIRRAPVWIANIMRKLAAEPE
ncbi:MAG: hypothetical protein JST38_09300 [Bacteroidetes bacterium]|nr:hypothetical protein [Bacteroidota bacterium]MBS1945704.1 hypothetical protein [Bacteroidota bacterium]